MDEFAILFIILGILATIIGLLVLYSDWREKSAKNNPPTQK